jgi:hypothetical protein
MLLFIRKAVYVGYVLFLMAFAVWYGYFMYPLIFGFEGKEEAAESLKDLAGEGSEEHKLLDALVIHESQTVVNDLGYKIIEQPYIEGRFHHIGFAIERDTASACVRCHGDVPHDLAKEVRSFLNMHVFYVACETCHVRPGDDESLLVFRWYDKVTGETAPNPVELVQIENAYRTEADFQRQYITYGNYGAKIAPGRVTQGEFSFLIGREMTEFVDNYLAQQTTLPPAQQSQIKKVIHRHVNKDPIVCEKCHTTEVPYLPFAALGYPPRRVEELTTTAVVGMINKYEEFWIPSLLQPGVGQEGSQ